MPLVNISQTFKHPGLELVCRKDTGIKTPENFKGKKIGIWYGGNEYPFLNWMSKLGIRPRRSERRYGYQAGLQR